MSTHVSPARVNARTIARIFKPEPGEPLHRQLESALRRLIHLGQVPPGATLPGELELAAELGMSRHTVRHSLGVLAAEGLVRRQRGRGGGTRVLDPATIDPVIERSLSSFYLRVCLGSPGPRGGPAFVRTRTENHLLGHQRSGGPARCRAGCQC